MPATTFFCLLLVISTTQQRSVYFDSEVACDRLQREILTAQGFHDKRFKAYEQISELGEGSFGTVLLAKHKLSGVKVAIKVIPKKTISKAYDVNKVKYEEIEIMEELMAANSPNMLQLIESFTDEKNYYIVSQYMPTGTLCEYICAQPSQPLDEDLTKSIIRQVATGIQSMHERNIIHKDIKVENILVTNLSRQAHLKIADFGSAEKLKSADDMATFQIGTPGYVAPEILADQPYTCAVDIYSIGALMFVLLTATLPFWSSDSCERRYKVQHEALDFSSDPYLQQLSLEAKQILAGMLCKDPTKRLTVAQVLAHPWLN